MLIYPFPPPFLLDKHSLFSTSLSVFLCGNMFICVSYQITSVSDIIGYMSFAFRLTSCSVIISRLIYGASNSSVSWFPWLICHCVHGPLLLYPFICWWTFWLLPCLLYCESGCSAAVAASVFSILIFSGERPSGGPAGSTGQLNFYFYIQLLSVLIIGCYHFTSHQQLEGTQFSKTPSAFIVCRLFADGQSTGVN